MAERTVLYRNDRFIVTDSIPDEWIGSKGNLRITDTETGAYVELHPQSDGNFIISVYGKSLGTGTMTQTERIKLLFSPHPKE